MAKHLDLGENGEDMAGRYVTSRGLEILERRVRYARGEIDIVAKDGDEWVFIEVKTRKGGGSGSAVEAFTPEKAGRMRRAVEMYVYEHDLADAPMRCDFLAIDIGPDGVPEFSYFPGEITWRDS